MSIPARATRLAIAVATLAAFAGPLALARPAEGVRALDVSRDAGIYEISRTRGATILDYDGDGWDDALIGRHYDGFYRLYRNDHDGTFNEITDAAFPKEERKRRDPHGCAAADVNQDGRVDVYCTTGGVRGTAPNPSLLWIQRPDGTYENRTREYRVADRWGRGRLATFLDANGDAYPDLFVGNASPRTDGHRSPNRLFINRGGERFRSARDYHVNREVGAKSLQVIDYNRDGRDDIFLCGNDGLRIYRNVRFDHYRNVTHRLRARMNCKHALLGRMNGDHDPDLVRVTKSSVRVHLFGRGGFRKPAFALRRRGGTAVALGNVDGNRRDDIYYLRSGPANNDRRDFMLVNKRGGHRFRELRIPQTRKGVGEAVTTIDYDRNGLDDFIVQNGHRRARGPIRLIAFR